jgi:outer membrane lipoprotein-sorting protein
VFRIGYAIMKTKKPSDVLALVFLLVIATTVSGQSIELNGEQVVARMAKQYADAKSYQDTGIVQTVSDEPNGQVEEIVAFKTYFVRPKQFRFEWMYKPKYLEPDFHIVWSDGNNTFRFGEPARVETVENLSRGIAGETGSSRGSAHTVAVMLDEEVSGFRATEMKNISLLREEQFEGENCFVVRGFHPFGFPIDLWISKKDFLLRKVSEKDDDTKSWQVEIRRNVRINEPIGNEMFHFDPSRIPQEQEPKSAPRRVACAPSIILPLALIFISYGLRKSRQP